MKLPFLALLAGDPGVSAIGQTTTTDIFAHSFRWRLTHQGELKYELYLPKGCKEQTINRWPLL